MKNVTKERFRELRQVLQQDGNQGVCPIWDRSPVGTRQTGNVADPKPFWSPRAGGVFEIPGGTLMPEIRFPDNETRKRVSSWIWAMNAAFEVIEPDDESEMPELTPALIRELNKQDPLPVERRIDRALQVIGRPPRKMDTESKEPTEIHSLFMAATECATPNEMRWLLHQLEAAGLLAKPKSPTRRYYLSLKGLDRLETGGGTLASNTAFVAMWFDDQVSAAYKRGIKPAIRKAGYTPRRIDEVEHADKIDDKIVAEIRQARFLVCDFTCGLLSDNAAKSGQSAVARGGVYYEAGLAYGLGKPVIWTCRKDLLDHVHFDVRQYNFIVWEDGKENELRKALFNRIRAEIV